MARSKLNIDLQTVKKAEEQLEKIKDSKVSIQLKAIIASAEHPVENVADVLKVSRRSVFRWKTKFREGGVEGLRDRPKGHMRSKLTEDHKKEIKQWILSGRNVEGEPADWTLKKLQKEVEDEFEIRISTAALWKHLRKMGLVSKKPRPVHVKVNEKSQEAFGEP